VVRNTIRKSTGNAGAGIPDKGNCGRRSVSGKLQSDVYAVLAVVFGQAVVYWNSTLLICGAFLAIGFHFFVILYEEPALRARFNGEYAEFCWRVPRWIPKLRR
jgi:hypothetical protein